ncbi:MAG: purine-nucleoside phosphorylase [Candidatus Pseudobacter hemicellulosilyticus]|uniref:Purine nucleoside phosphorylase n=1 Tax=Candidatus Pseudobacter hemicellulosilyticus TaxID=3121375 RepID=A0AAJ6BFI7_9BACT|nr:MAG: purine-nucleoside phosphorylase [Pseudobacter sp.]
MSNIIDNLNKTTSFLRTFAPEAPEVGIILGSGLGNLATQIEIQAEVPYEQIPHFPVSTVQGHTGKLIFGKLGGKRIVAMAGRFHFYEGYSAEQVVYPIRVMKMLGIKCLLISNAAGGVNPDFAVGDLMIINDHISFAIVNPLLGRNYDELGPRFPDMSEPYSKALISSMKGIAAEAGIRVHEGVYFGVTGPTFETRAEYNLIKLAGADAVGMSTVQEAIIAIHSGIPVAAISVITDLGIREEENVITHEEVLQAAREAEPKLTTIFTRLIASL